MIVVFNGCSNKPGSNVQDADTVLEAKDSEHTHEGEGEHSHEGEGEHTHEGGEGHEHN